MRDDYDRSSKWLLEHHGNSVLRLGGIGPIVAWRAVAADVVQPRQLPDGLLEVTLAGRDEPDLFLVEFATYPEARVRRQMVRDTLMVYLGREILPEVLTLVLRPRGRLRVPVRESLRSRVGWTGLTVRWRVIEIWKQRADDLLAAHDIGLLPWVPLAEFTGPPEPVLQECRRRIDTEAPADERPNLLAVLQVLSRLRFDKELLRVIFGGHQAMIESPLIQEITSEIRQEMILQVLSERFGEVDEELRRALKSVENPEELERLNRWAAVCPNLASFHSRLPGVSP